MYRRYYRYDDMGQMSPKFPGTEPASDSRDRPKGPSDELHTRHPSQSGEIITPRRPQRPRYEAVGPPVEKTAKPKSGGLLSSLGLGSLFGGGAGNELFKDGLILGKFHFDDILLGFLILILMQDKENEDLMLILALGYIFLGDGSKEIGQ